MSEQQLLIAPTRFRFSEYLQLGQELRRLSATGDDPSFRCEPQIRFGFLGNYYTGYYPVAFSPAPRLLPVVVKLVGKELSFVSEEEFFAHYLAPQASIGPISYSHLAATPHSSAALVLEPLGAFSCERFIIWQLLARLFQYANPWSPVRHIVAAGHCYDCEVAFDETTFALRISFVFARPNPLDACLRAVRRGVEKHTWIERSFVAAQAGLLLSLRVQPPEFRSIALIPYRLLWPECTWCALVQAIESVTASAAIRELSAVQRTLDFV